MSIGRRKPMLGLDLNLPSSLEEAAQANFDLLETTVLV